MVLKPTTNTLVEFEPFSVGPVGATAGPSDTVIVTFPTRVEVQNPNSSSSQPIASFSKIAPRNMKVNKVLSFDRFSHPAQFHAPSNRFIAITDNRSLTSWPATENATLFHSSSTDIHPVEAPPVVAPSKNSKRAAPVAAPTPAPIVPSVSRFLVDNSIRYNVITLDAAGRPTLHMIPTNSSNLSPYASNFPSSCNAPMAESLVDATVISLADANPILLTVTQNSDKSYSVHSFKFTSTEIATTVSPQTFVPYTDLIHVSSRSLELPSPNATLSSVSFRTENSLASIALFWSTSHWEVYSTTPALTQIRRVFAKRLHTCFAAPASGPISTAFIAPNHFAITGPINVEDNQSASSLPHINGTEGLPLTTDGSLIPGTLFFTIFELQYQTVAASTALPFSEPTLTPRVVANTISSKRNSRKSLNGATLEKPIFSLLPLESGSVAILSPTGLHSIPLSLPSPSLLSVMGQASIASSFLYSEVSSAISQDPATLAVSKASKLVGTLAPFLHTNTNATVATTQPTAVKSSATATVSPTASAEQFSSNLVSLLGFDREFSLQVQTHWSAFVSNADSAERVLLAKLFPCMSPIFLCPTSVTKTSGNITPLEFACEFFQHAASLNPRNTSHTLLSASYVPQAWSHLSASAYKSSSSPSSRARYNSSTAIVHFAKPFSPLFVAIVARYCYDALRSGAIHNDDAVFYLLPLRVLICSNSLSARFVPGLLSELARRAQWGVIQEALMAIHDIAEADLVESLAFALDMWASVTDESTTSCIEKSDAPATIPSDARLLYSVFSTQNRGEVPAKQILQSLLQTPSSHRFMEVDLKSLNITHVLIMLRYLLVWTQTHWLYTENDLVNVGNKRGRSGKNRSNTAKLLKRNESEDVSTGVSLAKVHDDVVFICSQSSLTQDIAASSVVLTGPPSFTCILDWICLLLDAHFTQIMMLINSSTTTSVEAETALEILQDLQEVISHNHVSVCNSTRSLRSFISHWHKQISGSAPKPIPSTTDYSIHIINL